MDHHNPQHPYPSQPLPPQIRDVTTLEHPNLKEVFLAWQEICGPWRFPNGPTLMLRPIRHLLKYVVLCDVVGEGEDFRFRVLGQAVFSGLKQSQKGRLVSEHPDPGIGVRFSVLMRVVVEKGTPVRGLSERITQDGQHNYRTETLWPPFGESAKVTRILSLAAFTQLEGGAV